MDENIVLTNASSSEEDFIFEGWDDQNLNLSIPVLRGIYAYGFEKPSPIQSRAIIPILRGRDIIAQAQSGTGKSGAFVISSLQMTDEKSNDTQVIIMSPTRELARQSLNVVRSIGNMTKIRSQLLIGGSSVELDIEKLTNKPPHIISGCPGRIFDMMRRKHLKTNKVKFMILDEADEMLSQGFKEQIYKIFQFLDPNIQIGLFSATLPIEINALTSKFMRNPIKILVKQEMLTLQGIGQYYVALDDDGQKYATLKDLFSTLVISQAIVYCNSIKRVCDLYDAMIQDNFPVEHIHSDLDEKKRKEIYENFKSGSCRVLVSTDLFSRGIDVQQVSIVINFDIPKNLHTYLHRIGRSGRWGRKGTAINFTSRRDFGRLKELEQYYSTEIKELPEDYAEKVST